MHLSSTSSRATDTNCWYLRWFYLISCSHSISKCTWTYSNVRKSFWMSTSSIWNMTWRLSVHCWKLTTFHCWRNKSNCVLWRRLWAVEYRFCSFWNRVGSGCGCACCWRLCIWMTVMSKSRGCSKERYGRQTRSCGTVLGPAWLSFVWSSPLLRTCIKRWCLKRYLNRWRGTRPNLMNCLIINEV